MKALWICLKAEALKSRRTLAIILTGIAPLVIVAIVCGFYLQHSEYYTAKAGVNPWDQFISMTMVYWNLLMVPLFITLETALIAHWEHSHKNWKLIFTQPVPRWAIYAAKQITVVGWMGLCTIVLMVLTVCAGGLLHLVQPAFGLNAALPWGTFLKLGLLTYLSSFFMMAFHLWFGMRWNSFVAAMGAGIVAEIVTMFIFGQEVASSFPWSIPGALALDMVDPAQMWISLAIGLGGGLLVSVAGAWDVLRLDVQ